MDRTTYKDLLKASQERLLQKRNATAALHELVKNLSTEDIRDLIELASEALAEADTASALSEKSGMPLEKIAELHEKISRCRV